MTQKYTSQEILALLDITKELFFKEVINNLFSGDLISTQHIELKTEEEILNAVNLFSVEQLKQNNYNQFFKYFYKNQDNTKTILRFRSKVVTIVTSGDNLLETMNNLDMPEDKLLDYIYLINDQAVVFYTYIKNHIDKKGNVVKKDLCKTIIIIPSKISISDAWKYIEIYDKNSTKPHNVFLNELMTEYRADYSHLFADILEDKEITPEVFFNINCAISFVSNICHNALTSSYVKKNNSLIDNKISLETYKKIVSNILKIDNKSGFEKGQLVAISFLYLHNIENNFNSIYQLKKNIKELQFGKDELKALEEKNLEQMYTSISEVSIIVTKDMIFAIADDENLNIIKIPNYYIDSYVECIANLDWSKIAELIELDKICDANTRYILELKQLALDELEETNKE